MIASAFACALAIFSCCFGDSSTGFPRSARIRLRISRRRPRRRLVRVDRLPVLGARLVAALPVVLRAAQLLARGLAAGRARGGSGLTAVTPFPEWRPRSTSPRSSRCSTRPFQPGIVGTLNDYKLAVVKVHGEFVWHTHDDTDDFFLVLSGRLTIQLRDRDVELAAGELFVVPRGVEHCPRADEATRGAADRAARAR